MQIRILNANKAVSFKRMGEVTSHMLSGPGSLFDPDIFGLRTETELKYGYINLKGFYIHPAIYAVIPRVFRELQEAVNGTKKFIIKDGDLIPDPVNGHCGMQWVYENFDKINFNKVRQVLDSGTNRMQSRLMKKAFLKLKKTDIFMTKLIVLPLKYRDINMEDLDNVQLDELNQMYIDLIKLVDLSPMFPKDDSEGRLKLDYKIQTLLQNIYDFISDKIFGKTGAQKSIALSRSVDNCTNSVIVAPEIKVNEVLGKSRCSLGYASVPMHHLMNMHPVHMISATRSVLTQLRNLGAIKCSLEEFEYYYTENYIKEKIELYYEAAALRFNKVIDPNGNEVVLYFEYDNGIEQINMTRALTWFEVFYMAMQMFIDKSRGIITRYPVTSKGSLVPVKYKISTMIGEMGKEKIYTDEEKTDLIDTLDDFPILNKYITTHTQNQIAALFLEATQFSNLYLSGLDGDYDGDRTNIRTVYSKEAVAEIDEYMQSPISALNIDGTNRYELANEAIQGLWNLTTNKHLKLGLVKNNKPLDINLEEYFTKDGYTLGEIIELLKQWHPETPVKYKNRETTLGRVIFNEVCFHHIPKHEFINEAITKSMMHDIMDYYAQHLIDLEKRKWFTTEMYSMMCNTAHDLGFGICDVVASTLDYNMLVKKDGVYNAKRKEIFSDIENIVENKDSKKMLELEDQLVDFMKSHYKNNQMADMYDSGCKPKWTNDFKTLKGSIGVAPIPGTGDFTIIKGNLKEGLDVKDIQAQANLQIYGAYNRAVETATGGYLTKKMYSAFQSTTVYNADCKSNKYLTITATKPKEIMYRWVLDGEKEVLITMDNADKYLNKPIQLRSPILCKHKKGYCRKCCGELLPILYKMDEKNTEVLHVGQFIADIGNKVLNANMKKTHDLTQKIYEIKDLDDFVI